MIESDIKIAGTIKRILNEKFLLAEIAVGVTQTSFTVCQRVSPDGTDDTFLIPKGVVRLALRQGNGLWLLERFREMQEESSSFSSLFGTRLRTAGSWSAVFDTASAAGLSAFNPMAIEGDLLV
ncbi:MAG: hypothetical protein JSS66_03370 [Armatimonadetes bacterium]|nr:hypothetical protein [Armatimonadota bacterium]